YAAQLLRNSEARLEAVFMEPRAKISATIPGVAPTLQRPELLLSLVGPDIEHRMCIVLAMKHRAAGRRVRIERDEYGRKGVKGLEHVHPVGDTGIRTFHVVPA